MEVLPSACERPPLSFDINDFQKGDPEIFKLLHEELGQDLSRSLLRMRITHEDARDIVASVFTKIYFRRAQLHSYVHIKSSLYVMTKNEAIDHLRQRSKWKKMGREFYYLHGWTEDPTYRLLTYEIHQQKNRRLKIMWARIEDLPKQQREILRLYFIDGLSTAKIAIQMKLSPQTVLNHKTKGLTALRLHFCIP